MSAAAAYSEPCAPTLTAQRGGLSPTTARMSFFDLQNRFWQLHAECSFKPGDSHLYFYLLGQFNAARWPEQLYRKRNQVAADLGVDVKSLDTARTRLEERGLLTYEPGDKAKSAVWRLLNGSQIEGKNSPAFSDSSQMEGKNSLPNRDNSPDSPHLKGKNSPLYKEEEKTLEQEEEKNPTPSARDEKKMGPEKPDLPHLQADDPGNSPPVARPPHDSGHFAALWETWPRKEKRPAALAAFAQLSEGDQAAAASRAETWLSARPDLLQREAGRYLPQLANWLSDQRWTDATPSLAISEPHANQPTSYPPRPVNGHKPQGHGGSLARFLAEQ